MAEAFGFHADNILTKDHFEAVLEAKLDARFAQQDVKIERRFSKQDRTLDVHTWTLGVLVPGVFVPQPRVLLGRDDFYAEVPFFPALVLTEKRIRGDFFEARRCLQPRLARHADFSLGI